MTDCSEQEIIKLREKVYALSLDVARLQEQEKASKSALIIFTKALEHSQTVANEWRQENIDQRNLYPTISAMDGRFSNEVAKREALEGRVYVLEKAGSADQGKHSAFEIVWVKFLAIVSLALMALGFIYKVITGR